MPIDIASAKAFGGSRQDRRGARTRAEPLARAGRLLAPKGFHGTKIADIAAAADVGTGTFYLYLPTKDALFADLVRETAVAATAATSARSQRPSFSSRPRRQAGRAPRPSRRTPSRASAPAWGTRLSSGSPPRTA